MDDQNTPIFSFQSIRVEVCFRPFQSANSDAAKHSIALPEDILLANEFIQIVVEQQFRTACAHGTNAGKVFTYFHEFFGAQEYRDKTRYLNPDLRQCSKELVYQAVHKLLQAFEDDAFHLIVDGQRVIRLDEEITFRQGTQAVFLKTHPRRAMMLTEPFNQQEADLFLPPE